MPLPVMSLSQFQRKEGYAPPLRGIIPFLKWRGGYTPPPRHVCVLSATRRIMLLVVVVNNKIILYYFFPRELVKTRHPYP